MNALEQKLSAHILAKTTSHLGEREQPDGSNSGPFPDVCLAYVGLPPGFAWCAGCASYCTGHSVEECGLHPQAVLRTASSHEAVNWAIQHGTRQTPQEAIPGDWCILRGGDGEKAQDGFAYEHTTILVSIDHAAGVAHWIGGNTGNAVAYGQSPLSSVMLLRPYVL